MGRYTLRLPETLHRQLETLAREEGVSLNQYIVYTLARQAALAYRVQPMSASDVDRQQEEFAGLMQRLGHASFSEIQELLAERKPAEMEEGFDPDTVSRLREKIAARFSAQ